MRFLWPTQSPGVVRSWVIEPSKDQVLHSTPSRGAHVRTARCFQRSAFLFFCAPEFVKGEELFSAPECLFFRHVDRCISTPPGMHQPGGGNGGRAPQALPGYCWAHGLQAHPDSIVSVSTPSWPAAVLSDGQTSGPCGVPGDWATVCASHGAEATQCHQRSVEQEGVWAGATRCGVPQSPADAQSEIRSLGFKLIRYPAERSADR